MIAYEDHPKIDIHDLTDDLSFEFPSLPLDSLVHYLRRSAVTMCREADLVQHKVQLTTQPDVDNYLLELADDWDVGAVLGVVREVPGCPPAAVARLTHEPSRLPCGAVSWFEAPRTIRLKSGSSGPETFTVFCSAVPSRNSCQLDERFGRDWYDVLLDGARALIYELANQPWLSIQTAAEYRRRFVKGYQAHKIELLTGHQRGRFRMNYERVM
jgi:hypothetical protein